jgi:hypothetical protein
MHQYVVVVDGVSVAVFDNKYDANRYAVGYAANGQGHNVNVEYHYVEC